MREKVAKRAGHRCEYCKAPENICAYTFHLEHIVPRSKGGPNTFENFALACFFCNNGKSAHTTGHDHVTGAETALFNPRTDDWDEHFEWSKTFAKVLGKTPVGRATVERLKMNTPLRKQARTYWRMTEKWP